MEEETKVNIQQAMKAEDVAVECSWDIDNLEAISQKIIWKEELTELTSESNIENCFMMSQPSAENATPCTLKISLKNNRKLLGLQILSEAPVIEVYGQYEEYLVTLKGDLLDEVDGTSLYDCRVDLKKLQSEIMLKFCKVQDMNTLWIYGISAATKKVRGTPRLPSTGLGGPQALLSTLMQSMTPGESKSCNDIEALVEKKCEEIETRMMKRINERFDLLERKIEQECFKIFTVIAAQHSLSK